MKLPSGYCSAGGVLVGYNAYAVVSDGGGGNNISLSGKIGGVFNILLYKPIVLDGSQIERTSAFGGAHLGAAQNGGGATALGIGKAGGGGGKTNLLTKFLTAVDSCPIIASTRGEE